MRIAAALLLASAAVDWPAIALDRAGVALLGLAALALALPAAPRRRSSAAAIPRGAPLGLELEQAEHELGATASRVVSYLDNSRRPA